MTPKIHKNLFKFGRYSSGALRLAFSKVYGPLWRKHALEKFEKESDFFRGKIYERVSYYNKLISPFQNEDLPYTVDSFRKNCSTSYYLDLKPLLNCYPGNLRFSAQMGDIRNIPDVPSFVKSRPIDGDNKNSVLLKLNQVRHYYTYPDKTMFSDKIGKVVWRGACHQPNRQAFVKEFYNKSFCDVGDVNKSSIGMPYHKSFMSIPDQLKFKYILSLEGNDVATNLKWIMASNSLCFMPKPIFETWFMEGLLIPGYHYVELNPDLSDLEEKVDYYNSNELEAVEIINNANSYSKMFFDASAENIVSFLVVDRYFDLSKGVFLK